MLQAVHKGLPDNHSQAALVTYMEDTCHGTETLHRLVDALVDIKQTPTVFSITPLQTMLFTITGTYALNPATLAL